MTRFTIRECKFFNFTLIFEKYKINHGISGRNICLKVEIFMLAVIHLVICKKKMKRIFKIVIERLSKKLSMNYLKLLYS